MLILLSISAAAVLLSSQINRWIPDYALSYSHLIEQQFQTKIYFKKASYHFPDYILFNDVRIFGLDKRKPMLQASRLAMGFSFPLLNPAIRLHSMTVEDCQVDWPSFKNYLTRKVPQIRAWAHNIPGQQLHLYVPNGSLYPRNHLGPAVVPFSMDLNLYSDHFSAKGSWSYKATFNYEFSGKAHDYGLDVEKLSISDGRNFLDLWGNWYGSNIETQGFIFYRNFYILDINGLLKAQKDAIVLKHLSFALDGDEINVSGRCLRQKLLQCDGGMSLQRQAGHISYQEPLKNMRLRLHAQQTARTIILNGGVDFNFLFSPHRPLQKLHSDFGNLTLQPASKDLLKLKVRELQTTLFVRGDQYKIPLQNILATFSFSRPYQKTLDFSADGFEGRTQGRLLLDTASLPWGLQGHDTYEDVDINQLSHVLTIFSQCHGLLSGSLDLQGSKNFTFSGDVKLHNGDFNGSAFQDWMARTLQMPSLSHVSAAEFSGRFKIDDNSKYLDDVKLDSDEFNLEGFFHLNSDLLVSSRMSVRFSQGLLKESDIGRHIIGLVHGAWDFPFEFSLSGNVDRMNFEWDQSPLKDKVHRHMFGFLQRMIDRRVDAHPAYNTTIPNESVSPG